MATATRPPGVELIRRILILGLGLLSGCVQYVPMGISTTSIGNNETPVAIVSGKSEAWYVLVFGPDGDDSLEAAWLDALKGMKADTLLNVTAERKITYFPFPHLSLVTWVETRVMGTAVKYKESVLNMPRQKALLDAK